MSKQTTATEVINPQLIGEQIYVAPAMSEPPAGYKAIDVELADDRHARLIVPEDGISGADIARVEEVATAVAKRNKRRIAGDAMPPRRHSV